jgi:PRTRC genetic system protein B
MKTVLNLGQTATFNLQQALLIYERECHHFTGKDPSINTAVSVHPIILVGKRPTIGPGQPVTIGTIQTLAAAVGKNMAACYLPPSVVSMGYGQLAWWCPAARRRIWFKADGRFNGGGTENHSETARVTRLNGKFVHHPALLFLSKGNTIAVFALAASERPGPNTPIYRAPYWNLWKSGVMCQGNRHVTDTATPSAIPEYEDAFFNSAFSHTNITKLCRFPGGHTALWEELAKRKHAPDTAFWTANLHRIKSTVGTIITNELEEE